MKRRILSSICIFALSLGFIGCNNLLDIEPLDKVSAENLLSSPSGLKTLLATLYRSMPMEDFSYYPSDGGFNQRGWNGGMQSTYKSSMYTDESSASAGTGVGPLTFQYWPYGDIRQTNLFFANLEQVKNNMNEVEYNRLKSEAHFIRAYQYFGLAKRYGGVPLITEAQDADYVAGSDNLQLRVPRSTEKETWQFILDECDLAIANLPQTVSGSDGIYRATKWAALALKSRVALHAASVAKYWSKAPLTGEAVTQNLAKMDASDANAFYQACIDASAEIISNGGFSLYMPDPATPAAAATNFQKLFLTNNNEIIFKKAYLDGTTVSGQGHCWDVVFSPSQSNPGFHKFGRYSPTLDMVDIFEDYSDNGKGESAPIITRTDGENHIYADPTKVNVNDPFVKYDNLYDPFVNKDARLLASVIVPGAKYNGVTIIMQGGIVKSDGSAVVYADASEVKNGVTYYSFGGESASNFSGFFKISSSDDANFSNSGFSIRKYLQEGTTVLGAENSSTTPFIDMRLAEVYLNYAEAVAESGLGNANTAAGYINALRKRAGHKDNVPLSIDIVQKERRVELAFEGFRYWDLIRRREYHEAFNGSRRTVLIPMVDLRGTEPKYIFVRANNLFDEQNGGRRFDESTGYYLSIPGITTNGLIQNPNR